MLFNKIFSLVPKDLDLNTINVIDPKQISVIDKPIFDMSNLPGIKEMDKVFNTIDKFSNGVVTVIKYVTNPILILKAIAGVSYGVFLSIAIGGVILYIIGYKKGAKITTGSIVGYTLIQAINCAL